MYGGQLCQFNTQDILKCNGQHAKESAEHIHADGLKG